MTYQQKYQYTTGSQWDRFLPGILYAYRNTPHTSTGEKPSFLLFGVDCRTPTEAAYLPTTDVSPTDVENYKEELMLSLSSARELAASCIRKAQAKYKRSYDRRVREVTMRVGDWVLVRFPQDESGRWRKLSRPWHGPYRIVDKSDPDVTCVKVYHPQDSPIHVHQSWVCRCPAEFPAGYYWYGGKRRGPGRPPRWVDRLLQSGSTAHELPSESNCPNHIDREEGSRQPTEDARLDGHKTGQQQSPERSLATSDVDITGEDNDQDGCHIVEGSVTPDSQDPHPVSPSQQDDLVGVGGAPESSTTPADDLHDHHAKPEDGHAPRQSLETERRGAGREGRRLDGRPRRQAKPPDRWM